jgi:hypothetical protein
MYPIIYGGTSLSCITSRRKAIYFTARGIGTSEYLALNTAILVHSRGHYRYRCLTCEMRNAYSNEGSGWWKWVGSKHSWIAATCWLRTQIITSCSNIWGSSECSCCGGIWCLSLKVAEIGVRLWELIGRWYGKRPATWNSAHTRNYLRCWLSFLETSYTLSATSMLRSPIQTSLTS